MSDSPQFSPVTPDRLAELDARLEAEFPTTIEELTTLGRIKSVSYAPDNQETLRASSERVLELLKGTGIDFDFLEIVRADAGDRPGLSAVIARKEAPEGRPTVMLYAHQDVQPVGDTSAWLTDPWEPTLRDGRLYGRGITDDKSGVLAHVTALKLLGDELNVGISIFIDGEEEDGSWSFAPLLAEYHDQLAADVLVVADSFNWTVDIPGLVTALRGTTTMVLEVETLDHPVHSGQFGGPIPDAVGTLVSVLATMYDKDGTVVVEGLDATETSVALEYPEDRLREDSGILPGVEFSGTGSIASRIWSRPSITIIGIDAPNIETSSNTLQARARARLSMRTHPAQSPVAAGKALREHLEKHMPLGARVRFTEEHHSAPYIVDQDNVFLEANITALGQGFGQPAVLMGVGGSVPFIADAAAAFPGMAVLLTGMSDFDSRPHSANESLHLGQYRKSVLSEIVYLDILGGRK